MDTICRNPPRTEIETMIPLPNIYSTYGQNMYNSKTCTLIDDDTRTTIHIALLQTMPSANVSLSMCRFVLCAHGGGHACTVLCVEAGRLFCRTCCV